LLKDRSGNVAMMWGLMGTVLVGLIGVTVDFTRAQSIRNAMQNAVDGAALVAERSADLPLAQRQAAARAFFDAEVGNMISNVSLSVQPMEGGGHRVEARAPMPMSLARIVNDDDWIIGVEAEAQAQASPPIEVALVLDNTGSMANDMDALRTAASDLAGDLLSLDGDTVRVALVPFVAQVNIGNEQSHLAWMDQAGTAPYNGELLEDRSIGHRSQSGTSNCTSGMPAPPAGSAYPITWRRGGGLLGGVTGGGNGASTRCYAWTPTDGVNYFTLFDRISNEDWKGCVEARPEPYDINDAAPNAGVPATMFVPFFWLDTLDSDHNPDGNSNTSNNYMDDDNGDISGLTMTTSMSAGGGSPDQQAMAHMFNPYKFRNSSVSLDITAPDTRGPNRGCPTPIVPLTTNDSTIQTNIAAMRHWSGGGTNQAEGLAWGWRVLSPTPPFTEGAAYGPNVRKVIVLMSDGENTNVGNDPLMASDYSAYNHMGFWRDYVNGNVMGQLVGAILHGILPAQYRRNITSSTNYVSYVNSRQAQLCTNIKNSDIEIYTVIFRETDQATENIMRNCASGNDHFFRADNAQELSDAFDAIGSGIGSLRLTH